MKSVGPDLRLYSNTSNLGADTLDFAMWWMDVKGDEEKIRIESRL